MQKKKIVHIAQSAGGVQEYLYMFFKNFYDENYENYLVVSQDYENNKEKFMDYVKDIYIVPMQREIQLKSDLKSIKEIKKVLKKIKPDIVYLHSSKAGALGRIALLFNFKVKILYNAHGWYFNAQISNKKKKIFALIERVLAIKTNKIINISKSEYEYVRKCLNWFRIPGFNPIMDRYFFEYLRGSFAPKKAKKVINHTKNLTTSLPQNL